jgi:hypothetical protein
MKIKSYYLRSARREYPVVSKCVSTFTRRTVCSLMVKVIEARLTWLG